MNWCVFIVALFLYMWSRCTWCCWQDLSPSRCCDSCLEWSWIESRKHSEHLAHFALNSNFASLPFCCRLYIFRFTRTVPYRLDHNILFSLSRIFNQSRIIMFWIKMHILLYCECAPIYLLQKTDKFTMLVFEFWYVPASRHVFSFLIHFC